MTWLDDVRAATAGEELLGFLERRLAMQDDAGPLLDDRRGEAPEDVFVELAREDEQFRSRLDETIATYFHGGNANPAVPDHRWVIRSMLSMAAVLSLPLTGVWVRSWLARHDEALRAQPDAVLGRAALDALATAMPRNTGDGVAFWRDMWRSGPPAWQWRAFVGLRLQNPEMAAGEIPELLRRLNEQRADPRALLLGMWKQPEGRTALVTWALTTPDQDVADEVRKALRGLLSPVDHAALGRSKAKHPLRTLAVTLRVPEAA